VNDLEQKLRSVCNFYHNSHSVVVAVDTHLAETVHRICKTHALPIHVLEVTPWGNFVFALNALVAYAANQNVHWLLFVSAELSAPQSAIEQLLSHRNNDVAVIGALLPGHAYVPGETTTRLSGTSCPWNTMAVWNLNKLALTGFQLVSDGLLTNDETEPSYGVEEVVAACLLQKLLGVDNAKALVVKLNGVNWKVQFDDEDRQAWHEAKMKSKAIRAERQLFLTGLSGIVYHC
jgi:hypothetical protein